MSGELSVGLGSLIVGTPVGTELVTITPVTGTKVGEFWALDRILRFEDFVAWTRSPAFAEAHANRPPREMFAGPNVLEVHEVLTSTDLDLA